MFQKDTFRLIGKTFKRFFSLVMIVLIGILFVAEDRYGKDVEE